MKNSDMENKANVFEQQNQLVVKSNDFVRKVRYSLTAQEQKTMLFLISKIKPEDEEFRFYEFDVVEFCNVCGINCDGGKTTKELKDVLKRLRDKSFYLEKGDKGPLCSWVEKVVFTDSYTKVLIRIDSDLKPYFLQLKENFTSYELSMTLAMKSKYSLRLYEILKSYLYVGQIKYELEDLKYILDSAKYKEYKNFRVRVIDKAVEEINRFTDINVCYEPQRTSRVITSLLFSIEQKKDTNQNLSALLARHEKLNKRKVD